jgi:ATP-dependent Clp protease ATP-binding subunit ClpA
MFERYTEKARRCIFFARYEASQFGSPYIDSGHFLLGLIREERALLQSFTSANLVELRKEIEETASPIPRQHVSTSVDLPLSTPLKRALVYASEEAEALHSGQIASAHLVLGLLRSPESLIPKLMHKYGITRESALVGIAPEPLPDGGPAGSPEIRRKGEREAIRRAGRERYTTTRKEGAAEISETHHFLNGHEVVLIERLSLSEDGKTLSYTQEINGPGKSAHHTIDFDLP